MTKPIGARALLEQEKAAYPKVQAPCPYFGTCGGCTLQDLAYGEQLSLKREWIRRAFASLGGAPASIDVVGLEDPWRYRNKAELTFGEEGGRLILGYHAARSFWRIVDLEDCLLLPATVTQVLRDARALAEETGLPAYHPKTHQGFFRYLLLRSSQATGQLLVCLITAPGSRDAVERWAEGLRRRHPSIASLYWGWTGRVADIAVPEEWLLLHGAPHLEEVLGPFRLQLHPLSFFQPSTVQAGRLYDALDHALGEGARGVAWDLYCGVGLVAFHLARRCRTVYGIDVEPRHLELAALNASLNGLRNIEFRAGRVEVLLMDRRFWLQEAKPEVVVVDPPRAGLHPRALTSVLAARPAHLAYISCNVQTLVRDLRVLLSSFPRYRLRTVQVFDMFPQTSHMEMLAWLERI